MNQKTAFIDTSGFFAMLVSNDEYHLDAKKFVSLSNKNNISLHTSDYILDEVFTLLKARKVPMQIDVFNGLLKQSKVLKVHWVDHICFDDARDYFVKHQDKDYSFTDCTSFCLMKSFNIDQVLTTDQHFRQAGFKII